MTSANSPCFRILPGETRGQDLIFPSDMLDIEHYQPSLDMTLSKRDRQYRPDMLVVKISNGEAKAYPFVLPCHFHADWADIDAAAKSMGKTLILDEPVKTNDDSQIGRSIISHWMATADGAVYRFREPGNSDYVIAEKLPITTKPEWIERITKELQARDQSGMDDSIADRSRGHSGPSGS